MEEQGAPFFEDRISRKKQAFVLVGFFGGFCLLYWGICTSFPITGMFALLLPVIGCTVAVKVCMAYLTEDAEASQEMYHNLATRVKKLMKDGDSVVRDEICKIMSRQGRLTIQQISQMHSLCNVREKHLSLVRSKLNMYETCFKEQAPGTGSYV